MKAQNLPKKSRMKLESKSTRLLRKTSNNAKSPRNAKPKKMELSLRRLTVSNLRPTESSPRPTESNLRLTESNPRLTESSLRPTELSLRTPTESNLKRLTEMPWRLTIRMAMSKVIL